MVIYRKIADISTKEKYDDLMDEMCDRYGDPPKQIHILCGVSLIRHLAASCGFEKVIIRNAGVRFCFLPDQQLDMQAISVLMSDPEVAGRIHVDAVKKVPELAYRPVSVQNERTIDEVVHILCVLNNNKTVV